MEQCRLQLQREPLKLPRMKLDPNVKNLADFTYESFTLEGYEHHPAIKGQVAV